MRVNVVLNSAAASVVFVPLRIGASFLPLIVIVTVAGALSISLLSDAMYSKTTSVVSPSPSDWKLFPKL